MIVNNKLIQNAVRVISSNTIYKSKHTHDFVTFRTKDEDYFIDGGLEYCRTNVPPECADVEWLTLYEDSHLDERIEKMIWGTYGITGREPLKYVLLNECETDHLSNILNIPNLFRPIEEVILSILVRRKIEERLAKL